MKHSKLIPASIVLVIVLVTLAVAGVAYGQADTTNQPENQNTGANGGQSPEALTVLPNGRISYQGRLLQNNVPVNATINITFRLYTVSTGGTAFWSETQSVVVKFFPMIGDGNDSQVTSHLRGQLAQETPDLIVRITDLTGIETGRVVDGLFAQFDSRCLRELL